MSTKRVGMMKPRMQSRRQSRRGWMSLEGEKRPKDALHEISGVTVEAAELLNTFKIQNQSGNVRSYFSRRLTWLMMHTNYQLMLN
jgi:hypothetical protein